MKKLLAWILCLCLIGSIGEPLAIYAAEPDVYSLANENLEVFVSRKNGGFSIKTVEGDQLKKSDNNKHLLYHNGEYDTSFTSFEVERGGQTRQYIFGGSYGFLGLDSSDVTVTRLRDSIQSQWDVDGIRFTQTIELPNTQSLQHGMASIAYKAEVLRGGDADIRVRVLLDTALDTQDYGYYTLRDQTGYSVVYEQEAAVLGSSFDSGYVPETIYAANRPAELGGPADVGAYTIDLTAYQVIFGHWNNLAATVFDYTPDPGMTFTNAQNLEYATADSACALYNDLGTVAQGGNAAFSCYYGVYSNQGVSAQDAVAFNLVAPNALELSRDKKSYVPTSGAKQDATFTVSVDMANVTQQNLSKIAVAAYTTNGITPLKMDGSPVTEYVPSAMTPYRVDYENLGAGEKLNYTFQFKADVSDAVTYRRVELRVYDTSGDMTLSSRNLIGSKGFSVLCPGGDGKLPQVTFTGADPKILYYKGRNQYIITGSGFGLLSDPAHYSLKLVPDLGGPDYTVDPKNVVLDPEKGTMTLLLEGEFAPGPYHVYINWKRSAYEAGIVRADTPASYTSEALRLIYSEDIAYKNDTYGIAAVVQDKGREGLQKYHIMAFRSEEQLADYKRNHKSEYNEILLEFRGQFEMRTNGVTDEIVRMTGTSRRGAEDAITINQCLDFQDGIVEIYRTDDRDDGKEILVDFHGALYTSGERTCVSSGSVPAAFTAIENGTEVSLLQYDLNGQRKAPPSNTRYISLIWGDDGLQLLQSIGGSLFQLGFGIMGQFRDDNGRILGNTVSFTAGFDLLGVLIPKGQQYNDNSKGAMDRIKAAFRGVKDHQGLRRSAKGLFAPDNDLTPEQAYINQQQKPDVQILVHDVLFAFVPDGVNDDQDFAGFYGFHVSTDIVLPQYTAAMPRIVARADINTIRNYNFSVAGDLRFGTVEFGVRLGIVSIDNTYPVLDDIFIYCNLLGGPGIPIDPAGVVMITGGGGGFSNIYDTIICADTLPTLKVLLRLYFSVVQVLTCQADASFSLQGIEISMSNLRLLALPPNTPPVMPYAGLKLQWLPNWYFHVAVNVDLFQIVTGGGYIVVDQKPDEVFFEAFLQALIRVPDYVGLIGGVEVGGARLGFNSNRVWGAVEALGMPFGIVYYWGDAGSFDFGAGVGDAEPTYPELLPALQGLEPVLLGYDEKAGKNLYMRVGTNLSLAASAQLVEDLEHTPVLMAVPTVQSLMDRKSHKVTLDGARDRILTLVWESTGLEQAKSEYARITGLPSDLKFYDSGNPRNPENAAANANLTYNPATRQATLAITRKHGQTGTYTLTTPVATDVTLINVAGIPELKTLTAAKTGSNLNISYSGEKLEDLDELSFYLMKGSELAVTENVGADAGVLLGTLTESADITSGRITLPLPGDLQTGDYYVRAVYSQEGIVSDYLVSAAPISHSNPNQPAAPVLTGLECDGDLRLAALLGSIPSDVSGYLVNVYNEDGSYTAFADAQIPVEEIRNNRLITGGSFTVPKTDEQGRLLGADGKPLPLDEQGRPIGTPATQLMQLEAGKSYKVGVRAYRDITDSSGNYLCTVVGEETVSSALALAAPTKAAVTVSSNPGAALLNQNAVTFTVRSDEALTGVWSVGNGYAQQRSGWYGRFDGQSSLTIPLTDLPDNEYALELWGTDETGDQFSVTHRFTVDTRAPRLVLSSPINGTTFGEDGTLVISGMTDPDALITVESDGVQLLKDQPLSPASVDENGCFRLEVKLVQDISSHRVTVSARDAAGNLASHSAKVNHQGLGLITSLDVYVDENGRPVRYSNRNIDTKAGPVRSRLSLVANTEHGSFTLSDDMVRWAVTPAIGAASVDAHGSASFDQNSEGYLVGMFQVSSVAPMTAAATFGTLENSASNTVSAGSTIGGRVTGGGIYLPGETVTLTAVPDSGYRFTHWTLEGAAASDLKQPSLQFTMPAGAVTATAHFESENPGGSGGYMPPDDQVGLPARAGQTVTYRLQDPVSDPNRIAVQYSPDGGKTVKTVAVSLVDKGTLRFRAPASGVYHIVRQTPPDFSDIGAHWGRDNIRFVAARGIVLGVGGSRFDPEGRLTRAMFVTMLGRVQGELGTYVPNTFRDCDHSSWYEDFVSWAAHNGIVLGHDDLHFAPEDSITREQICVMLDRYLTYLGIDAGKAAPAAGFADQSAVSPWAASAVNRIASLGIVIGDEQGRFLPQGQATRAETATMLTRLIRLLLA